MAWFAVLGSYFFGAVSMAVAIRLSCHIVVWASKRARKAGR